jgi:tRNA threonylcarbamoyladenosine biosynthesis protein TsaB
VAEYLILALETSSGCGSVSLTRGTPDQGRLISEITCRPERAHCRALLSTIQWMLEQTGVSWQDLSAVAVSLGPGSFTGLRIGLAAAKGMAMATGLPLLGVVSLDALALQCQLGGEPLLVVADARRGEVYAGWYVRGVTGLPERRGQIVVCSPDRLVEGSQGRCHIAGPGIVAFGPSLLDYPKATKHLPALIEARASSVGFLAAVKLALGDFLDPATAAPLYIRASEAEINLERKLAASAQGECP